MWQCQLYMFRGCGASFFFLIYQNIVTPENSLKTKDANKNYIAKNLPLVLIETEAGQG